MRAPIDKRQASRLTDKMETDPEYVSVSITADELRQIDQVLRTSAARLEDLYRKVGTLDCQWNWKKNLYLF